MTHDFGFCVRLSGIKFNSVFSKLFASVMLALVIFAGAMVVLSHLVHDTSANTRHQVIANQVTQQLDPLLAELRTAQDQQKNLETRYLLALVRRSFNIYSDSLNAKFGLYDGKSGEAIMIMRGLPATLPPNPPFFSSLFPRDDPKHPTEIQVNSQSGYVLLYQSKLSNRRAISPAINLLTGTLLLLLIMSGMLWMIARTMTWRINQLSRQITQLGDGDFSARVTPVGNDEITLLARGFNQTAERIETLMNANKLLLAHASHEIRTPITRIRLQVEMMTMLASQFDKTIQDKVQKRADAINRDLTGLNDLVESILLVSRMDAGHAIEKVEDVDLYELIKNEIQHYPQATFVGGHVIIQGQAKLLTHLVRNLLDNAHLHGIPPVSVQLYAIDDAGNQLAIDALPTIQESTKDTHAEKHNDTQKDKVALPVPIKDTTSDLTDGDGITVDAEMSSTNSPAATDTADSEATSSKLANKSKNKSSIFSRKKSDIVHLPEFHQVCIAVIDQGTGIPEDKRSDIFSPFVRLQQEKKGSGLGLSLVAQIVKAHGGRIITDTLHGHTRFLVTLPITQS
ncbi:HAMP domain-containing protein [Moraxella osloensis]|uniref:sensor histidine kinase n=1 Tax=Faucicola osloensis TaxID=34062 RepID=UPI0020055B58|nr:sensor histidine kinase [Moraxella osloensis]MCK6158738.1 HAMP domain-containing protein [Moraxella osloensis]